MPRCTEPPTKSTRIQQSVGSTGNGVSLSGLIEFAPQFESQGSCFCWENMCLSVRAETSSLGCGTGLKVPPTVGALPRIPRGQIQKKNKKNEHIGTRQRIIIQEQKFLNLLLFQQVACICVSLK